VGGEEQPVAQTAAQPFTCKSSIFLSFSFSSFSSHALRAPAASLHYPLIFCPVVRQSAADFHPPNFSFSFFPFFPPSLPPSLPFSFSRPLLRRAFEVCTSARDPARGRAILMLYSRARRRLLSRWLFINSFPVFTLIRAPWPR